MPKQRSPDRDKAFEIYKEHNGDILLADIASELSLPESTIRCWKNRDNWSDKLNETCFNKNMKRFKPKKEKSLIDKKLSELVEDNDTLTEKQKLFCVYFVQNFNATLAAIKAGYSIDCARQVGYKVLQKSKVKEEIKKLKAIKNETLMLDSNDIVEQYMKIAFADITDFTDFGADKEDYNFVHFKDSSLVDGSLISEVSVGKNSSVIKLADKMKALEWLSRYFLMNPMDKHKIEYDNKKLKVDSNDEIINSFMKSVIDGKEDKND